MALRKVYIFLAWIIYGHNQFTYGQAFPSAHAWWIPSQTYIKFKVANNAIYRVYGYDLNLPSSANPQNLHLFFRGQERPIYVFNQGNPAVLEPNDFIEFYGQKNDGKEESYLYRNPFNKYVDPTQQPNDHYSLFTDTSAYFLTWDSQPGLRYTEFFENQYSLYPTATHMLFTSRTNFTNYYNVGGKGLYYAENADYVTGEGWTGSTFTSTRNQTISTPFKYFASSSPATATVRLSGISDGQHNIRVEMGNAFTTYATQNIYIQTLKAIGTINDITSPNTTVKVIPSGLTYNGTPEVNVLCWIEVSYDRTFTLNNDSSLSFRWVNNASGKTTFTFSGAVVNGSEDILLYDLTTNKRIIGTANGSNVSFVVPKLNADTVSFFYSTQSGMLKPVITSPSYVNLADPNAGAEFVIITHSSLLTSAQNYATYRDTNTVNRFSTKVVTNDQIFDEFGYGSINVLAYKRFVKTALDNWTVKPKYIFLWGKGLHDTRNSTRGKVYTWGLPACDFEYVSNFFMDTTDNQIIVPIGRINVNNDTEGQAYLEKIIEYEHTEFQPWMKNGLHLGGGQNANEQSAIRYYLEGTYEPIFEGSPYVGNIFYHQKTTGAVIGPNTIDIKNTINNGVSLITFFGHSSSNIFDIEIDSAHTYLNYGKYPFMIALGCYSGNFSIYGNSFGEHFTLEPKRGCIGYLSSSGAGYLTPLGEETKYFYEVAYRDSLGSPIGNIIKAKVSRINNTYPNNQSFANHTKTTNLQCDPALKLYFPKLPELAISQQDIAFIPNDLTAQTTQFQMQITIHNYGKALEPQDSFNLSIKQTILQSGQTLNHTITRSNFTTNQQTLTLSITIPSGVDMAGPNIFEIYVDSDTEIDEYSEANNIVRYEKFIYSKLPVCIFPTEFAVINKDTVTLKASTYSVSLTPTNYEFEIDTVWEFNSPMYRKSGVIQGTSFLAEWKVPYTLTDSTVYYWRVRLPDSNEGGYCLSSFKYIRGPKEGWAQSRPPQFFDNPTQKVAMDKVQRLWQFAPIKSRVRGVIESGGTRFLYQDGAWLSSLNIIGKNGIIYTIFNKNSLKPITYNLDYFYQEFLTYPNAPNQLASVIQNMRQGDYILIFLTGSQPNGCLIETWNTSQIQQALYSIGCSNQIQQLGQGKNVIILGRKGAAMGSAIEKYGNPVFADLEGFMYGNEYAGQITTKTIGPSSQWNDLIWDWYSLETANTDEIKVNLYGKQWNGQEDLLLSNLSRGTYSLTNIDAQTYPYLRLEAIVKDSLSRTAPQLDNWHVLYAPVPEALIDPTTAEYVFYQDTLQEGDSLQITLVARNITDLDMDSLLVQYQYKTALGDIILMDTIRLAPLLGLQQFAFSRKLPTRILLPNGSYRSFIGQNYLIVTINPNFDQPEQYLFNNIYEKSFFVIEDKINPILDVTFDGKHITDGDIVSPKPEILIEINDENKFLTLTDTSSVEIYIKKASDITPPARIFFGSNPNKLEFIPATQPQNKAKIYYRPDRMEDDEYILFVQGLDVKQNLSGKVAYQIRFKVINESTITHLLNYPNPFSTQTRFVYTLTGAEIPEVFKIQIFTISGKLVKEIDLKANNDVFIGQNITNTSWDGTDEFGDKLANGVYLYKVLLKMPNQQTISTNSEKTKQYFNNGYGKMVIMR